MLARTFIVIGERFVVGDRPQARHICSRCALPCGGPYPRRKVRYEDMEMPNNGISELCRLAIEAARLEAERYELMATPDGLELGRRKARLLSHKFALHADRHDAEHASDSFVSFHEQEAFAERERVLAIEMDVLDHDARTVYGDVDARIDANAKAITALTSLDASWGFMRVPLVFGPSTADPSSRGPFANLLFG